MSSKFDACAPPFRPVAKDIGQPVSKPSKRTGPRGSKGFSRQLVKNMSGENAGRRFHEQRKDQKSNARNNRSLNRARDTSPYDKLATGTQAPDNVTYINTNCHFVVDKQCNVRQLCTNPNAKVPVRNILRVVRSPLSCPICLEESPEAPRMLDCGHVMCYPCLLRYEKSINDDNNGRNYAYKECPLCFEEISSSSILPVAFQNHDLDAPRVGHDSVFRLLFRPMNSLLASPLDTASSLQRQAVEGNNLPSFSDLDSGLYSRVITGSTLYAVAEYSKEIALLKKSKKTNVEMFGDDGSFHDKAISLILQEIRRLESSDKDLESSMRQLTTDDEEQGLTDIRRYTDNNAYFFYQTGFGLSTKYFLSPLDVRILRAAFGSFSAFPPFLIANVQRIVSDKYANDDLTKRIKYMGHLPAHTPVGFIECDWKGVISDDVLRQFDTELGARRNRHNEKLRKEERERRQFEACERDKLLAETNMGFEQHSSNFVTKTNTPGPALSPILHDKSSIDDIITKPTVWGTRVIAGPEPGDDSDDSDEFFKILDRADGRKRGGRKKIVLYANRSLG